MGRFLAIGDIALSCKAAPCWAVLMATSLSRLAGTAFLLLEFRTRKPTSSLDLGCKLSKGDGNALTRGMKLLGLPGFELSSIILHELFLKLNVIAKKSAEALFLNYDNQLLGASQRLLRQ